MWTKTALVCGVCAVVVAGVFAREQTTVPGDAGSLAGVTAELRSLREAVEKSADMQAQVQALGVYLSAQQSRLVQTANRADSIKRELDAAVLQSQAAADEVDNAQGRLNTANDPPEVKARIQMQLTEAKQDASRASTKESQLRVRDAEASQALQTEMGRWNDLIARLEQTVKK